MKLKAKKIKKLLVPKYEFRDNSVLKDPKGLLAALQQAQQTRRRGFANRLHLTPLDVYAAGEQYPDDMSGSDIPEANWQARDDDPGMTTDMFCYRHKGSVYTQTHRELKLLDSAGGTLPQPPGHKKPAPPFGLFEGWTIYNRMHCPPDLSADNYLDGVRNPALLVLHQYFDGSYFMDDSSTRKYPTYWELLKNIFTCNVTYKAKTWVLAVAVENPMECPEKDLKKHCYGFAVDDCASTLELTEGADAMAMFYAALSQAFE